jgi:hypothetical protein
MNKIKALHVLSLNPKLTDSSRGSMCSIDIRTNDATTLIGKFDTDGHSDFRGLSSIWIQRTNGDIIAFTD